MSFTGGMVADMKWVIVCSAVDKVHSNMTVTVQVLGLFLNKKKCNFPQ